MRPFMKICNVVIFSVIMSMTLWVSVGIAQTEWEKYPENPVLNPGPGGEWDDVHVSYPAVLFDDVECKMWYGGYDGSRYRIGYATSTYYGLAWTKYHANPVVGTGPGAWDSQSVYAPTVLFDGAAGMYKMWYAGHDGSNIRIGYATSGDGVLWSKDNVHNPVLDIGGSGEWDDENVHLPTVFFDGAEGVYKMWYAGYDGSNWRIGYATSPDGIVWTKYDDPTTPDPPCAESDPVLDIGEIGEWDDDGVHSPNVLFRRLNYEMWYAGQDSPQSRIGYATSSDGISWYKRPVPVLDMGVSGAWDDDGVRHPDVFFDATEGKYKMWYTGADGSQSRIGYAVSLADLRLDIEAIPNPAQVGQPLTVQLDLENVGLAINGRVVLAAFFSGNMKIVVNKGPVPISSGFEITDYPLLSVPALPSLPPVIGLVCALFDVGTGEMLVWDVEVLGIQDPVSAADELALKRQAAKVVQQMSLSGLDQAQSDLFGKVRAAPPLVRQKANSRGKLATTWANIKSSE